MLLDLYIFFFVVVLGLRQETSELYYYVGIIDCCSFHFTFVYITIRERKQLGLFFKACAYLYKLFITRHVEL